MNAGSHQNHRGVCSYCIPIILLVGCLLVASFSVSLAWASEPELTITTLSGDTSQGWVGFSPDDREATAKQSYSDTVTVYAMPADGYEFKMWAYEDAIDNPLSTSPSFTYSFSVASLHIPFPIPFMFLPPSEGLPAWKNTAAPKGRE